MRQPPRRHRVRTRHPRYSTASYLRGIKNNTNIESIRSRFTRRGYQPNPLLEDRRGADLTLVKPILRGGRIHIRVKDGRRAIRVEGHVDRADPARDPVKHLTDDILGREQVEHITQIIPKRRCRVRKP